jgi:hypothetical protein
MSKLDVQNLTVPELANVTVRAMFAIVFPTLLVAALCGAAVGVTVATYQFTVQLLT